MTFRLSSCKIKIFFYMNMLVICWNEDTSLSSLPEMVRKVGKNKKMFIPRVEQGANNTDAIRGMNFTRALKSWSVCRSLKFKREFCVINWRRQGKNSRQGCLISESTKRMEVRTAISHFVDAERSDGEEEEEKRGENAIHKSQRRVSGF